MMRIDATYSDGHCEQLRCDWRSARYAGPGEVSRTGSQELH